MIFDDNETRPIYYQIADWLKDQILTDKFKSDEKIFSQYQLADIFNINPATAAKGINILVEEKILYKKRGLGMFIAKNGKELIMEKRKNITLKKMITDLLTEAKCLNIDYKELMDTIRLVKEEIDNNVME